MPKSQTIEEFAQLLTSFLSDAKKTSEVPNRRKKGLVNRKLSKRIILESKDDGTIEVTLE